MAKRSLLAPVQLNGTTIGGVFSNRAGPVRDILRRGVDGNFHVTAQSIRKHHAAIEVKTLDAGSLIALLTGSTDLPAVALDGTNGYKGYFGLLTDGMPSFQSGSVHETRQGVTGTVWTSAWDWSEGGDLEATLQGLLVSSDGTVQPLVYGAAAMVAIPATGAVYDLTSLTVNGATITDCSSFSLRFDPKFSTKRHPGSVLARGVFSDGNPVDISLALTLGDLSALRGAGASGATGNVAAVFTARANNAGLGSATLSFGFNGEWSLPEDESAAVGGDASGQVVMYPRYDGTNKPATWAAA